MALTVTMTGSGSVGIIQPGWSVLEQCTPAMPGDSRGSVGSASFTARATADSRFVANNDVELVSPGGTFLGRVSEVAVGARADVSVAGAAQFLNVDRTMPPIWLDNLAPAPFGEPGDAAGQFQAPLGVAADTNDGSVYVTDFTRCRVVKFDAGGHYLFEFGTSGSGNGQFGAFGPFYVAVDPADGAVYVTDPSNSRVQKFDSSGTYVLKFGSNGSGNGQFGSGLGGLSPYGIAVSPVDGMVYVTDPGVGARRIQKFNSSGVYQAKVTTYQASNGDAVQSPWGLTVDAQNRIWTTIPAASPPYVSVMRVYSSALAHISDVSMISPQPYRAASAGGFFNLAADGDDVWVHIGQTNFIIKINLDGVELDRIYAPFTYSTANQAGYAIATSGDTVYMLAADSDYYPFFPPNSPRVYPYVLHAVTLSAAILTYMQACDPLLNGWTLDYQATTDPAVVFPGWSGNVWANLKELFATYNIELVQDASTKTFIIRDIGSVTTEFKNMKPATTRPVNLTGGRIVDVIYRQPRAGGGVVWDAAAENESISIAAGARTLRILATDNHPAELAQPVATDVLPIQPGQYYIVDSTGTHVPAETWQAAGGNLVLAVGESPGTISATFTGPVSNPDGFAGPYSFATGNTPTDTPALSIVGNGTFTTPALFTRAGSQGSPFNSPFIDTIDRILSRGHYPSLQDPHVVVELIVPTKDLPAMGQAVGTLFTYEQSTYRIVEVSWGNLNSTVTAERFVTFDAFDTVWAGETLGDLDTSWSGFSLSDIQIQPLRN